MKKNIAKTVKGTCCDDLVGSLSGSVILESNSHTLRFLPMHLLKVCVPTLSRKNSGPILHLLGPLRITYINKDIQPPHCRR
jgi:hypothetical protein